MKRHNVTNKSRENRKNANNKRENNFHNDKNEDYRIYTNCKHFISNTVCGKYTDKMPYIDCTFCIDGIQNPFGKIKNKK